MTTPVAVVATLDSDVGRVMIKGVCNEVENEFTRAAVGVYIKRHAQARNLPNTRLEWM